MTKEDIIRLAEEAGFECDSFGIGIWDNREFNKFANLIAAAEREKCADELFNDGWGYAAKTIRARSQNEQN